jgi:hypothetical protein
MTDADFTDQGLLSDADRTALGERIAQNFVFNVEKLRQHVVTLGARPVFVTQTAFAWNGNNRPPRGVDGTVQAHGRTINYADVAYLHQAVNRALLQYCVQNGVTCFDVANDVTFDGADYYDYLHNTPKGAEKIGTYLADRLSALDIKPKAGNHP